MHLYKRQKMTSKIVYQNGLRTQATHTQSGISIITDAPTDNKGKGEAFSPSDLVATALASCMLTIMGIKADEMGVSIKGTTAETEKIMASEPRRISQINIHISVPLSSDDKTKKILERAAFTCPVAKSLSADLVSNITFSWN
jgi:putative redox protein